MDKIVKGIFKPIPPVFCPSIAELVRVMLRPDPNRRPTVAQVNKESFYPPPLKMGLGIRIRIKIWILWRLFGERITKGAEGGGRGASRYPNNSGTDYQCI